MFEIGCLRFLERTWKRFLNPDVGNHSEHTLRVVWVALMLAKYEGVKNQDKVLKMALVHDLPESRTGDVDYISRLYTKRNEEEAIKDILKDTVHDDELLDLWQEYEKRESIEAKIVKDADNLDVELELKEQESRGHKIGTILNENRKKSVYPNLYTETAKKFWEEIDKSNPNDWHLKGRNRFNHGDWKK